jgi:hypothetical protein
MDRGDLRRSYLPSHDGFCCVQLSILEASAGVFLFRRDSSQNGFGGLAFGRSDLTVNEAPHGAVEMPIG